MTKDHIVLKPGEKIEQLPGPDLSKMQKLLDDFQAAMEEAFPNIRKDLAKEYPAHFAPSEKKEEEPPARDDRIHITINNQTCHTLMMRTDPATGAITLSLIDSEGSAGKFVNLPHPCFKCGSSRGVLYGTEESYSLQCHSCGTHVGGGGVGTLGVSPDGGSYQTFKSSGDWSAPPSESVETVVIGVGGSAEGSGGNAEDGDEDESPAVLDRLYKSLLNNLFEYQNVTQILIHNPNSSEKVHVDRRILYGTIRRQIKRLYAYARVEE